MYYKVEAFFAQRVAVYGKIPHVNAMKLSRSTAMRGVVASLLLFFCAGLGFARDVLERPEAIAPTVETNTDGLELLPSLYLEMAYHNHAFRDGRNDSFQIRQTAHAGIVAYRRFQFGLYYGTYLFSGPVDDESRQGSDLAPWLMNGLQFEYGLTTTWTVSTFGTNAGVALVGEYGRRSYHPFRRGFAEPAADILRGGVILRNLSVGSGDFDAGIRGRWSKLFDFWGSKIPDPGAIWSLQTAVEGGVPLSTGGVGTLSALGVAMSDLYLIGTAAPDVEIEVQGGLSLDVASPRNRLSSSRRIDFFVDLYRSPDTEERTDETSPVLLLGLGGRIVIAY